MPSSSLFLSVGSVFLSTLFARVSATAYILEDSYSGANFFDGFNFNSNADPTHGYVKYLDYSDAKSAGLISTTLTSAKMGVDHTNNYTSSDQGRPSVRIETKKSYTHGLFIADIQHMPGSICGMLGSWPAFWSLGSGVWPANGEIDIIEGVNMNTNDLMVLHTADNCSIAGSGQSGTLNSDVCDVSYSTSGCSVTPSGSATYGTAFNNANGGVYAVEWTSAAIKMWLFPRGSIPTSITLGLPDTSTFGTPQANFAGSCDIDSHFYNHTFIFDTTFCGDWAGNAYASSGCPMTTGMDGLASCVAYVGNNPSKFAESYWEINSFKVYRANSVVSSSSSKLSSRVPVASTSPLPLTTLSIANGRSSSGSVPATTTKSSSKSSSTFKAASTLKSSSTSATPTSYKASISSYGAPSSYMASSSVAIGSSAVSYAASSIASSPSAASYVAPASSAILGSSSSAIAYATTNGGYISPTPSISAKETITTVITTSYVDICPTGFTTSIITQTVTYCPGEQTSGAPAPGFTTKVTVCEHCAPYPTTVTLTVPTSAPAPYTTAAGYGSPAGAYSSVASAYSSVAPAYSSVVPVSSGVPYGAAPSPATTLLYSTKVLTMQVVPVPSSAYAAYSAASLPAVSVVPANTVSPYVAPSAPYVAPAASYVAPAASYVAPAASYVAPAASYIAPAASYVAPVASYVAPAASYVAPAASYVAPSASYVAPPAPYVAPSGGYEYPNTTVAAAGTTAPSASYTGPSTPLFTGAAARHGVGFGAVVSVGAILGLLLV
ncbi:glycoside hydrolase family 16 protein [Glonium stellatum]|uniref:endo-1,3(4)-beta-glucanase n=1 Tax=Glonium stellatum TaxID=574774 RepID=A0A8E2JTX4_9PEZI|nr:glycoside hydrolase family 16 protein [Glonium stellatum]